MFWALGLNAVYWGSADLPTLPRRSLSDRYLDREADRRHSLRSSHRYALIGLTALALLGAGCSSSSSSTATWAKVTSASAGGGMAKLVSAAKQEGTVNVIALPPTWANYGAIISDFTKTYGIKVNSALPDGTSQQEVDAVKTQNGTSKAPDVMDLGMAVSLANT